MEGYNDKMVREFNSNLPKWQVDKREIRLKGKLMKSQVVEAAS
jgi:hypothetical protein